jgi:guanidinopropionase
MHHPDRTPLRDRAEDRQRDEMVAARGERQRAGRMDFPVEGLDPVFAPGTGTPEIGGMTTREAQEVVRGLQGLNLIGGDVVEVSPPFDPSGNTALVGATFMFEIMCLLADAVARRRS